MPHFLRFFLCLALFSTVSRAQTVLTGKITDLSTGQLLSGVNILLPDGSGTVSDMHGHYRFTFEQPGTYELRVSYIGFEMRRQKIVITGEGSQRLDLALRQNSQILQQVVVTASRFEQKREQLTISTTVIKPSDVTANNSVTADDILNRTPGIHVLRGQISIRGSSGYTLGVGSRVMMLLDGLPLLTAESGEVRWNFIPIENVEQIEVIKGSGSALYGSSALGGVVHFRSAMPDSIPQTKFTWFNTFYDRPPSFHTDPWAGGQPPVAFGMSLSHRQRFGKLDFVGSINMVGDQGYRVGEPSKRVRGNVHFRYQLAKGLHVGLSASHLIDSTRLYTFWESDTNAFVPAAGSTNPQLNSRSMVDPYIAWEGKRSKHSLRNRFYRSYTNYNNEDFGLGEMYYSEYQFQHRFSIPWASSSVLTAGLVNQRNIIRSDRLFGTQNTDNRSAYAQFDQEIGRFTYGIGLRHEQFIVNGRLKEQNPIARAGFNVRLWKGFSLRSSYGQGFRSPSVAEMFSNTFIGSVRLASDPTLLPESSRAFEVGFLQNFKLGGFEGQLDVAWFRTDYSHMIEYNFGVFLPGVYDAQDSIWIAAGNINALAGKYARFQPGNIVDSYISGIEAILSGKGQWNNWGVQFQLGYTYTNPINKNPPLSTFQLPVDLMRFLKYRYLHLVRTDVQLQYKRLMLGANVRYNSVILNIDEDFYRFMPGLSAYRLRSIKGDLLADLRVGMAVNTFFNLNFIVRNAGNRSWMPIPGNIGEQRNFVIQMQCSF
jgi:iron complex outermembrane receptor protein